ncbi:MAG: DUF1844 domain-containing protein [Pirellulaceae bacterium]
MSNADEKTPKIIIDEDWKTRVQTEREQLRQQEAETGEPASEPTASDKPQSQPADHAIPPASFLLLVQMLASQAMMALQQAIAVKTGEGTPEEGEDAASAPELIRWAKHQIDTMAVLKEKTKGNLDDDEQQFLNQTLQELRMAFISVAK